MFLSWAKLGLIGMALLGLQKSRAMRPELMDSSDEPALGIELTLDDLRVAIAMVDSGPVELASVEGDESYKCLMRRYLELCQDVKKSQVPPWSFFEYRNSLSLSRTWHHDVLDPQTSWRDWFQVNILGKPEAPWSILEKDDFIGDAEVAVLAEAMGKARSAAEAVLENRLNVTLPQHPFVSIAAPSFLWTAIRPRSRDGEIVNWVDPDENTEWIAVLALKFAGAAHRAGFRRHKKEEPRLMMESHAALRDSPINPASCTIEETLHPDTLAIVVEWNNATLSFWVDGPQNKWTPWSTYPNLGKYYQASNTDKFWSHAAQTLQRLLEVLRLTDEPAHFLLTGNAWDETEVELFKESLEQVATKAEHIELKGKFAGSLGAASSARYALHVVEICRDPLWQQYELDAEKGAVDREL